MAPAIQRAPGLTSPWAGVNLTAALSAMQSLMSSKVGSAQQRRLQGALGSVIALATAVSPGRDAGIVMNAPEKLRPGPLVDGF